MTDVQQMSDDERMDRQMNGWCMQQGREKGAALNVGQQDHLYQQGLRQESHDLQSTDMFVRTKKCVCVCV